MKTVLPFTWNDVFAIFESVFQIVKTVFITFWNNEVMRFLIIALIISYIYYLIKKTIKKRR